MLKKSPARPLHLERIRSSPVCVCVCVFCVCECGTSGVFGIKALEGETGVFEKKDAGDDPRSLVFGLAPCTPHFNVGNAAPAENKKRLFSQGRLHSTELPSPTLKWGGAGAVREGQTCPASFFFENTGLEKLWIQWRRQCGTSTLGHHHPADI